MSKKPKPTAESEQPPESQPVVDIELPPEAQAFVDDFAQTIEEIEQKVHQTFEFDDKRFDDIWEQAIGQKHLATRNEVRACVIQYLEDVRKNFFILS